MGCFRALKHRNYKLFFGGQSISLMGTFLTNTATGWLAFLLARDPAEKAVAHQHRPVCHADSAFFVWAPSAACGLTG